MELAELDRDNHYSTHYQEIRLLANPVKVFPVLFLLNCIIRYKLLVLKHWNKI